MERYIRFEYGGEIYYGLLEGEIVRVLNGDSPENFKPMGKVVHLAQIKLLAPCAPTKVVSVGTPNHKDAIQDADYQPPKYLRMFVKPASTVNDPGADIYYPPLTKEVNLEVELGIVIGKRAQCVSKEEAAECIWGYTAINDVTAMDLQRQDGLWDRSKSFDTFLPMGPAIVSGLDISSLAMHAYVNGEEVQSGNTANLIYSPEYLVSYFSHLLTLEPGDVIITGTPTGFGKPIQIGDKVEVEVEGIGRIRNQVVKSPRPCHLEEL